MPARLQGDFARLVVPFWDGSSDAGFFQKQLPAVMAADAFQRPKQVADPHGFIFETDRSTTASKNFLPN
jgi:hypothetical protein